MPNTALTYRKIKDHVKARLGYGAVEVELVDSHFNVLVQDALDDYNRLRPFRATAKLSVTESQKRYGPLDSLHSGFQGIVKVQFVPGNPGGRIKTPWNIREPQLEQAEYRTSPGEAMPGDYLLDMVHAGMQSKVEGGDTEFKGQWEGDGHYYLYVSVPNDNIDCSYTYVAHYNMLSDDPMNMLAIPDGDTKWFRDYVLAGAKATLASIRGKFEGIPGPDDAAQPVDWSRLQQEAESTMEQLREELAQRRRPLPPITG